jgi:hypothetical protein
MSWQRFLTKIKHAQFCHKALLWEHLRISHLDVHETNFGNMPEGKSYSKPNRTIMMIEESIC